jgi:hypothetical protein
MPETFASQLATLFGGIQAQIAGVRTALSYPQLNGPDGSGTGTIAIGHEYINQELAAPSIVIVPLGEEAAPAQRAGQNVQAGADGTVAIYSKILWSSWLTFEARLWGDPDPNFGSTQNVLYDFDSTLELRREFLEALWANGGGIPGVRFDGGRWIQPQDDARSGRGYLLSFSVRSRIDQEPYIYIPFATATTPGVTLDASFVESSPAGGSSVVIGSIIAPP